MLVRNNLLNYKDKYIFQDTDYFKMSLDSLLLSQFVTVNLRDKKILDIATGNAPIPMLLTFRTKAHIWGVELNKEVHLLGRISIAENEMKDQITLIHDDAKNLVNTFESDYFDVITCNPPYFKTKNVEFENNNDVKAMARHERTLELEDVFRVSKHLLKNNGKLAIVHRTERLMEIIDVMKKYNFEMKKIRFVYPNKDKNSDLVLIECVKNGKPGLKLLPPLFVYKDRGIYSDEVKAMFGE